MGTTRASVERGRERRDKTKFCVNINDVDLCKTAEMSSIYSVTFDTLIAIHMYYISFIIVLFTIFENVMN